MKQAKSANWVGAIPSLLTTIGLGLLLITFNAQASTLPKLSVSHSHPKQSPVAAIESASVPKPKHRSPEAYAEPTLKDVESLVSAVANLNNRDKTYHLFSHGKPGELLIEGKWLNAAAIVAFVKPKIQNSQAKISALNIYGCDFAQGEKGLEAVSYIEEALDVKVAASTNVTGIDGDWLLEVGNKKLTAFSQYTRNLQVLDTGSVLWAHNSEGVFPNGSPRAGASEEAVLQTVTGDINNIVASTVDGMLGPGFRELNQFFGFGTEPNQTPVPVPANERNVFEYFLDGADSATLGDARNNGDYVQYELATVADFGISTRVTLDRLSLGSVANFQGGNNFNDYSIGLEVSTDGFATAGQVLYSNFFRTRDNSNYNFIEGDLLDFELAPSTTYTFRMYVFNDQGTGTTGDDRGGFGARFTDAIGRITIDDELFQLTRTIVTPPEPVKSFSPVSIRKGGVSTLTINLSNPNGTDASLTSTFVDNLPAGVTVASPPNIGGTCNASSVIAVAGGTSVQFVNGATIPVGGCSLTVDVTSTVAGPKDNVISVGDLVTSFGTNTEPTNASLFVQAEADLDLLKVIVTPEPYSVGQTVEYTITVTNNGPDAATDVLIEDLPDGLTITSVSSPNCSAFPCTIPTMANGAVETITVLGTVQ